MPAFRYVAKRGPQDVIEGVIEAENRLGVLSHLTALGYTPVRINEALAKPAAEAPARPKPRAAEGRRGGGTRVPVRHLNQFTRQFASLMRSQVPLLRALGILKDQTPHPALQRIIEAIGGDIRQGDTLSGALAKHPTVFSELYVNLTYSGEVAGMLDQVLDRLAEQADRDEALRSKIQSAMAYPLFVGVVGLGTVVFLLTFVLPRLLKLFRTFGGELPLPTRLLLTLSGWCQSGWFWGLCAALALALAGALRSPVVKRWAIADRVSLRLPAVGSLVHQLELARFARSFGLLLNHGVPILRAIDVAIPVVRNRVIRQQLERLPAGLKDGNSLAACLKTLTGAVTPFVVHTVAVSEEGGKVGEALVEVATYYDREIERSLHMLASLLEPMMVLAVGAVVGIIVMAVLLPIFEMSVIAH